MTPMVWKGARNDAHQQSPGAARAALGFARGALGFARGALGFARGLGALLIVGATSGPALAHAIIVRTSPPQSGVGAADVGKVDVWYDAGIREAFVALAVVNAAGERVDKRDAAIDAADPAHVAVGVNPLTPGKYTVRYRALSADGHMVSGAWEFDVK